MHPCVQLVLLGKHARKDICPFNSVSKQNFLSVFLAKKIENNITNYCGLVNFEIEIIANYGIAFNSMFVGSSKIS